MISDDNIVFTERRPNPDYGPVKFELDENEVLALYYTEPRLVALMEMNVIRLIDKAYILADNRMALDAGWDDDLLKVELEALQGMDFDLGLTGFDEKEIADLFAVDGDSEVEGDDFDLTAALEKAAFAEKGDIWTVGRHKLMCGDATDPNDVDKLMGDKKANLIVTDGNYGFFLVCKNFIPNFVPNVL